MTLLNLNRIELDNLRRVSLGTPSARCIGGGGSAETEPEYTFYLKNNSSVAIPAESVISPLLVWNVDPWTVTLEDGLYSSTSGLFGTLYGQDWDRDNSPYDALLASVIIDHVCYLRLHDKYASTLTASSDICAWEVVSGDGDGKLTTTSGQYTQKFQYERRSPLTAPNRFYAVNEIPAGAQGEIKFINDVRPCWYSPEDGKNRGFSPVRTPHPYTAGDITFCMETQYNWLQDTYVKHRAVPRYLDEYGNVLSWFIYNPSKSLIATGQNTSFTRNVSSGLATKFLVASIPSPTVSNYVDGALSWTAELDYWSGETQINNTNGRRVYTNPWIDNDYDFSGASVSNKTNGVYLLGLGVDCFKYFGTWGGYMCGEAVNTHSYNGLGYDKYAILAPINTNSGSSADYGEGFTTSDPLNIGQSLKFNDLSLARANGMLDGDIGSVSATTPLFRFSTRFPFHFTEGLRPSHFWLEPVFPSTRLFWYDTLLATGTILKQDLSGLATTTAEEANGYVVGYRIDVSKLDSNKYCYIIKSVNECYEL